MHNLKVFLALSVFLFSGCVVSLKKYNLKADEAMKYQAEAQSLNDKMSQLSADYNKLSSEKEALDVRIAEMEKVILFRAKIKDERLR